MAINKVVYGNNTLLDLTEDTVTEEDVLEGKTFHDASGQKRTGSATQGGRVQDVEVNGESVINAEGIAEVVVPVSGDVSITDSFESYTGGKVKSVQMECKPIQDLHGYDHPWVGGSEKNKLPLVLADIKSDNTSGTWSGNRYTFNNGTIIDVLTDSDDNVLGFKASGSHSAPSQFFFNLGVMEFTSGVSYILNGITGGSNDTYRINVQGVSNYFNGENTIVGDGNSHLVRISIMAAYTSPDFTVNPMIRLATESDPTFEPYENKCPISAHTQVKLEQRSKNLFNQYGTSTITNPAGSSRDGVYIKLKAGTYTVSLGSDSPFKFYGRYKADNESTWSGADGNIGDSNTFTLATDGQICIYAGSGNLCSDLVQPMLEESSTKSDYEPYQGKDYIINLGGNYYWIKGDVVSGKWYVVGQSYTITSFTGKGTSTQSDMYGTNVLKDLILRPAANSDIVPCISNGFVADVSYQYAYNNHILGKIAVNTSGSLYVTLDIATLADANTWVANNPIQVVYPLATPIPLDLTPQQILAIIGENNFSAPLEKQEIIEIVARNIAEFNEVIDDENISDKFTYSSEKIEDRLDEYVDKDAVEVKSATTEFETYNGGLLSECIINLIPVQSGSGDPSPDNVRPISGHAEVKVGDDGKNKLNITASETTTQGITFTPQSDGGIRIKGTNTNTAYFYPIGSSIPATWLNKSFILSGGKDGVRVRAYHYDGTNSVYSENGAETSAFTFTSASSVIDIYVPSGTTVDTVIYPMLRLASDTDPTYVPYNGYQVTVNLGGTYYSGTLDVVGGKFTVDKVGVDLGSISYTYESAYTRFKGAVSGIKRGVPTRTLPMDCSCYFVVDDRRPISQVTDGSIYTSGTDDTIYIHDSRYTIGTDLATALTGQTLCFPLDTPQTIQLSPTMVKALVGENHLSAPLEGQEIGEVKYKEAFDFNDVIKVANYFTLPLQTFTFTNKVCDVNDSRITSDSLVDVYFTSDSMSSVEDAGITVESQNGKIVMTAEEQPVGTIQGRIKVVN